MSQFGLRSCIAFRQITVDFPLSLQKCNSTVISVRWRKHRFVPKTQSKIFYVRKPTPIVKEETEFMKERYAIYRTKVKAIRSYFVKVVEDEKKARKEYQLTVELEQELLKVRQAMETNKIWNAESAKLREARKLVEEKERAEKNIIEEEKETKRVNRLKAKMQAKIDENLKVSDRYITEENIDEEIEKVLDSRKDYNFPIDRKGRRNDDRKIEKTVEKESIS